MTQKETKQVTQPVGDTEKVERKQRVDERGVAVSPPRPPDPAGKD